MPVDKAVFEAIQTLTGTPIIDEVMLFLAEYLVVLVPLVLVYIWFKGREGKHDSVLTFGATATGIVVAYAMGLLHQHPNPSQAYNTIVAAKPENAFPSQHTAAVFSAAWPLIVRERERLGYIMVVAALATGFARVYIGEHWPVDILGAAVASLAGLAVVKYGDEYVELLEPVYELSETVEEKLKSLL